MHEIERTIWILVGTTLGLAESIGLHRDGALLKLSPFDTEIRLRLWWHLCLLDSRAPEDHGLEYTVNIFNRGLRLPLNVNDSQLYPDMKALPSESDSWTEMSLSLIQIEAARILHPVLATANQNVDSPYNDIQAKRALVHATIQRTQQRYFSKCNMAIPLHRVAFHHFFSACDKLLFMLQLRTELYLPQHRQAQDASVSRASTTMQQQQQHSMPGSKDSSDIAGPWPTKASFQLAYNTLKRSCFLLTYECSSNLKWIFRAYTQWYALAYVLRCLSACPQFPTAMATWDLVDRTFNSINRLTRTSPYGLQGLESNSVWSWLKTLREEALRKRQQQPMGTTRTAASVSASATTSTMTSGLVDGTGSGHRAMDGMRHQQQLHSRNSRDTGGESDDDEDGEESAEVRPGY